MANASPIYGIQILPVLRKIQDKYGYLKRDELERFSQDSCIPLYRLQEVASFFPHFHLTPPTPVTVRICCDMACHLAGAASIMNELNSLKNEYVHVDGMSCVGRCDRAPAVCIGIRNSQVSETPDGPSSNGVRLREFYCLQRRTDELKEIVRTCVAGKISPEQADRDAGRCYPFSEWRIDPYRDRARDYRAVKQLIAARDVELRRAAETLSVGLRLQEDRFSEVLEKVRHLQSAMNAPVSYEWVDTVLGELNSANLRGMGGAGVPASQKWRDVRDAVAEARRRRTDERAFIVVNGDESEPGTFKDRELLLHFPHLVLEGMIIAALVTDATQGFIYIRHEYPEQIEACRAEILRAESLGVCGNDASLLGRSFPVSVFVSPGGYICGEQSALLEVMSDRRGEPRNLPPKLETNGLDDRPTLVSNVETFAWVPYIMINGGDQYANLGISPHCGRRFFSVCGDVKRPGVYEVSMGLTLGNLIYGSEYCQGITGDRKLKAIAPSGPSGGFLPAKLTEAAGLPRDYGKKKEWQELAARRKFDPGAQELDILNLELELNLFRALSPTQMLGAGIVIYAEGRDMAEEAVNALAFYRNESCGKCVPCRIGSQKMANLGTNLLANGIDAATWTADLLPLVKELAEVMNLTSICGLGRSIPMPLWTLIDYFREDFGRYLT